MMFSLKQARILEALMTIPYYPREQHALILEQVYKFARSAQDANLEKFVDDAVQAMRQWSGVGELRGLWCNRYKPADGVEACSTLPGHSPADIENERLLAHHEVKALEKRKVILDALKGA